MSRTEFLNRQLTHLEEGLAKLRTIVVSDAESEARRRHDAANLLQCVYGALMLGRSEITAEQAEKLAEMTLAIGKYTPLKEELVREITSLG